MTKAILSEGYGIMPNAVLFDQEISSTAKLLLCYLMSLSASTGWCRPRNKHLAEKLNIKPRQVTNLLEELRVYIFCSEDEKGRRTISLAPELTEDEGGSKKLLGGTQKIAIHSNINSINKKYTSDELKQIKQVYLAWLRRMVVPRHQLTFDDPESLREATRVAGNKCKLTDSRKTKIHARIKSMGLETVIRAVHNIGESDWHRDGANDRNWKASPEFLFKNDEKIEEWAGRQ